MNRNASDRPTAHTASDRRRASTMRAPRRTVGIATVARWAFVVLIVVAIVKACGGVA